MTLEEKIDRECRDSLYCPVCQERKDNGNVLCWTCFKYIKNNWKESGLNITDYLKKYTDYVVCKETGEIAFKHLDPEEYEHIKHYGIVHGKYQEMQDYQNSIMF